MAQTLEPTKEPLAVRSLAFSADDRWLAIACSSSTGIKEGRLIVWDIEKQQRVLERATPDVGMTSVDFSQDGVLAAGQFAPQALLIDVLRDETIGELTGHTDHVRAVKFTHDGKRLVTGSYDKTVKVWDLNSRTAMVTLVGHANAIYCISISTDDSLVAVAVGKEPYQAWLWDLNKPGEPRAKYRAFGSLLPTIAISPDSQSIAAGSWDGKVSLFRVEDTGRQRSLEFDGAGEDCVSFSPDNRWFAASGNSVHVMSLPNNTAASEAQTRELFKLLDDENYQVRTQATEQLTAMGLQIQQSLMDGLSSNSAEVRWRSRKIQAEIGSMKTARELTSHVGERIQTAFSKSGRWMASGDNIGAVKLWDTDTWSEKQAFQIE